MPSTIVFTGGATLDVRESAQDAATGLKRGDMAQLHRDGGGDVPVYVFGANVLYVADLDPADGS